MTSEQSYTIRFTPRRPGSVWSRVNIARFAALEAAGQMTEAGKRAAADGKTRTNVYSYEEKLK